MLNYKYSLYPSCRDITFPTNGINTNVTCDSVTFNCTTTIKQGDRLEYTINESNIVSKEFKSYLICNYFKNYTNKVVISEELLNDTTTYLLPLLGESRDYFMYDSYLFNAYIDEDKKYPIGDYFLFLTYRFFPFEYFLQMEKRLQSHKDFIYKFDNEDKRFVTFVFQTKFKKEYDEFTKSKFHTWGKDAIELLQKFHNLKNTDEIYQILTNSDDLRNRLEYELGVDYINSRGKKDRTKVKLPPDMSLRSKIDITNETLRL